MTIQTSTLPTPDKFGLPEKFNSWRSFQSECVESIADSVKPLILGQATGFGKSLVYIAAAQLTGYKTIILTSTKALQKQLINEFSSIGLVEMKGRSAYPCVETGAPSCDNAPCQMGVDCSAKDTRVCYYYNALGVARRARVLITNYHFYFYYNRFSEGLPTTNLLVLDEAHDAPDVMSSVFTINLYYKHFPDQPVGSDDALVWNEYINRKREEISEKWISMKPTLETAGATDAIRELFKRKRQIESIPKLNEQWFIFENKKQTATVFAPLELKKITNKYLIKRTDKLLLTSATIRRKTAELLGIADYDFIEYPSSFPVENRPIYYIPTARVQYNMSDWDKENWLMTIGKILSRVGETGKGIIHAVSYKRSEEIETWINKNLNYLDLKTITHTSYNLNAAVKDFKTSAPGTIIISPSLTTGYDFPGDECDYIIISKLPFPDSRDPLINARKKLDKEYGYYLTAQTIVQAAGRATRSKHDKCKTFIIDDNWRWFYSKYKHFMPEWFTDAVIWLNTVVDIPKW